MQNTNTSVLARRVRIDGDYSTLAYEAGWASEALFFVQVEGEHPDLSVQAEVSPDGITWLTRGEAVTLSATESIVELPLANFGNWLRLSVSGASREQGARILIHLNLKG